MPPDRESTDIKKAMAYDILKIIKSGEPGKSYTADEIEKIIDAYITGLSQK